MKYQNILVIQTAFLGDVILTTPTVRALKQIFPDSKIDVLTIPETSVIFKNNPAVNKTIQFDKKRLFKKLFSFCKLIIFIRKQKYDLAISIQSSMTSSLLMKLGKIPNRTGFAWQKLLTIPVSHEKGLHVRERHLCLLRPFSDKKFDNQTELFWQEPEEKKAQKIIDSLKEKNTFLLGMAPGSVWETKKWLKEYFIVLLKILSKEKIKIILIGGKAEKQLCQEIIDDSQSSAINLAGSLTILESTALINKIDLMVTNDSAPLHIANAVQTDVIAIFGPTVRRFGCYPFRENDTMLEVDLYCRPCSKHGNKTCPEKHFRCMKDIKPEIVYDAIKKYLNR